MSTEQKTQDMVIRQFNAQISEQMYGPDSKKEKKNRPQKLLIIGQDHFISQSSPDHSPQPRIDFSYYEISGKDICSLICGLMTV